jgi:hypothetical protein
METNLRLIIDTETGLATVDGHADFKRLDAVIIGQRELPDYIGQPDDPNIWIYTSLLENMLDFQEDHDRSAFRGMLDYARSKQWVQDTVNGEQVRVHVSERITT